MSEKTKELAGIEIIAVTHEEYTELADLASRTFSDAFGHVMDPMDLQQSLAQNRSVEYFEATADSSIIYLAKQQDKIVGYVHFGIVKIPEIEAHDRDRELGRLYVDTALHGQGIGRQLLDAALAEPRMRSAPNIYLQVWEHNQKAIPLYEQYGFKTVGVTHFEFAGKPAQDLIMVRAQPNLDFQNKLQPIDGADADDETVMMVQGDD